MEKFYFKPVTFKGIKNVIRNITTKKVTGGEIPLNDLKQPGFTQEMLKDCIDYSFLKNIFPGNLKLENITISHKKDEKTDKENYRPMSILPLLSKTFER